MTAFRYAGNRILSLFTRILTGLEVKDSQCGFTAITREAVGEARPAMDHRHMGSPERLPFRVRIPTVESKIRKCQSSPWRTTFLHPNPLLHTEDGFCAPSGASEIGSFSEEEY